MFFQTSEINAELLSVIDLEWERVNANAGARPFHALSLRLKGGASFFMEGRETLCAEEGDITFAPADLDFRKQAGEGRILVVHFTAREALPQELLCFRPRDSAYYAEKFGELYTVWTKKQVGYEHKSKMLFYKILYEIEREWAEEKVASNSKMAAVSDYIHEHFTEPSLSVEALADRCGMSDTYFRKLFSAEFGVNPLKYINRLRLDHAKELLRSNYYSVEEIAERSGFNNIHYFSYFIKKETGLSPLALRRELLERIN